MPHNIVILGGDNRQNYIKQYLLSSPSINQKYTITDMIYPKLTFEEDILNSLKHTDILIAPLPITSDGTNITIKASTEPISYLTLNFYDLINILPSKSTIFAGGFNNNMTSSMSIKNINYYDYLKDDCIQQKNAIATAEGAIMKAIELGKINIQDSNTLILGYGKCGKMLAKKLYLLDSKVSVCARGSLSLCEAYTQGYNTLSLNNLIEKISNYDFIFNTIPATILNSEVLDNISSDTIIIDIASRPGGLDYNYASKNNLNVIHYLGIPGKISPKTSGYILGEYIKNHLEALCVNP